MNYTQDPNNRNPRSNGVPPQNRGQVQNGRTVQNGTPTQNGVPPQYRQQAVGQNQGRPVPQQQRGRPNMPPDMTPQQKAEYLRRLEAQRRAQQQNGGDHRPKYRKRKRAKPNIGLILFAVIILIVVGIAIFQINKNGGIHNDDSNHYQPDDKTEITDPTGDEDAGTESGSSGNDTSETAPPETTGSMETPSIAKDIVTVNSADINLGDLILVNYQREYALADTVSTIELYGNKSNSYYLSTTKHRLTERTLAAMDAMADAFGAETGYYEILVVSAYRSTEDQQAVYASKVESNGEEYAKNYVAVPGFSEHHTGMAVDLSFYRPATGATIPVAEHEQGGWLTAHCAEYGFILRYPESKVDITRIAYEPWHFRYVGKPHAAVIMKQGLCLEEYLGSLKDYTFDGTMLHVLEDGTAAAISPTAIPENGYVIYYVPVSAAENTDIPIPAGYENYSVSGNNEDGFIVTVYIG